MKNIILFLCALFGTTPAKAQNLVEISTFVGRGADNLPYKYSTESGFQISNENHLWKIKNWNIGPQFGFSHTMLNSGTWAFQTMGRSMQAHHKSAEGGIALLGPRSFFLGQPRARFTYGQLFSNMSFSDINSRAFKQYEFKELRGHKLEVEFGLGWHFIENIQVFTRAKLASVEIATSGKNAEISGETLCVKNQKGNCRSTERLQLTGSSPTQDLFSHPTYKSRSITIKAGLSLKL